MFIPRHLHLAESEILKWLVILTLASILTALAARLAAGEELPAKPAFLPAAAAELARPMNPAEALAWEPQADAMRIWQVLAEHKQGNFDQALEDWQTAPLTCDAEVWRSIAFAHAYLGVRDLDGASGALETALAMEPDNAIAHYFRGILRLEQASQAKEWYDAVAPTATRLVAVRTAREPGLTKSMYQLAARMEFERALETAMYVPFNQPLGMQTTPSTAAIEPTVRDLLVAVGAEEFEGKAHHLTSYLLLERGEAALAEQHLDAAAALGQHIVYGYQDLGLLYERQHEHLDAVRAYTKTLSHGSPLVEPTQKIYKNLREAVFGEVSGFVF